MGKRLHIDNDIDNDNVMNESEYIDNDIDNDNVVTKKSRWGESTNSRAKARTVDNIADHLVRKFKAPECRQFFCKCAWKLPENKIWEVYEKSTSPGIKSPIKYFVKVCNTLISRYGT